VAVIEVNRNPSHRELNQFGFIWLGFFLLVAVGLWLKLHSPVVSIALGAAAVVVPVVGWAVPRLMRVVYVGLSYVAWPIGFVVSHVLLGAVYYLLVTPIGLILRVARYDPMHRRFDPEVRSYWIERDGGDRDPCSYFRQF
jgi:multisubunit Na+/H+ antiporter MnhG subunit